MWFGFFNFFKGRLMSVFFLFLLVFEYQGFVDVMLLDVFGDDVVCDLM